MIHVRTRWAALLFVFVFAAAAFAQQLPVTPNTVWAGGDGKFESAPDTALVEFSLSVQLPELKAAYAKAQQSAQNVRDILHNNQIEPKNAEIGSFSMMPVYDWSPKRKLVGYQVSSHVTVKIHDFSKLGPIIDSFSQNDSTDSLNLVYTLENIDSAKAKAVEDAYRKAHLTAETLAHAGGRTLGEMSYASVDANEFMAQPRPLMMKAQRMATADKAPAPIQDLTPAMVTMTAHVNVLFQLK